MVPDNRYIAPNDATYVKPPQVFLQKTNSPSFSYLPTWNYLLNLVKTQFGVPYVYGGKNPKKGQDCSGFITNTMKLFNIDVGQGTINQLKAGEEVPINSELKPGYLDIIISSGEGDSGRHVYFVGPNNTILDSNSTPTLEGNQSGPGTRKNTKRKKYYSRRRFYIGNFLNKKRNGGKLVSRKRYERLFNKGGRLILKSKKGSKIHIKKENRGKFTKYCNGKVTDECIQKGKHSSNPKIRKQATFAANARKWNKK